MINFDKEKNKIIVTFKYDPGLISKAESIPTAEYKVAHKHYEINPSFLETVIQVFPGLPRSEEIEDLFDRIKERERFFTAKSQELIQTVNFSAPLNNIIPFKHQADACIKILQKKRVILADDMGLGKTLTSLLSTKYIGLPIYIIAPKTLGFNWALEAKSIEMKVNIHSWSKLPSEIPDNEYILIIDEAHFAQNFSSVRTKAFLKLASGASFTICVTGTPIKNGRPSNLYPLLCAIKHPLSFDKRHYELLFCNAKKTKGRKIDCTGASNLDVLWEETKDWIIRRTKEECLDLPPKIRTLRVAEPTEEAWKIYKDKFNSLRQQWLDRTKTGLISNRNEKLIVFTQLRHAASWAKIEECVKIAEELKEQQKQCVFFVFFEDSAKALQEQLSYIGSCGLLSGSVKVESRKEVVEAFTEYKVDFLVSTFGVGGLGLTLASSHYIVLMDRPWTPGDAEQAEDRTHRIGQKSTVMAYWIQCNGTDQAVDGLLLRKQKNISTVLTGNPLQENLDFDIREEAEKLLDEIFDHEL